MRKRERERVRERVSEREREREKLLWDLTVEGFKITSKLQ